MDPIAEHYGWTDTLPNWITAVAALGALGAAIWAGFSAHKSLVELEKQAVDLARSRLDEQAPIILATARPITRHDSPWVEYQVEGGGYQPIAGPQPDLWRAPSDSPTHVPNAAVGFVRTTILIKLANVSRSPAVVTFLHPERPEGVYPGEVRPGRDEPPLDQPITIAAGAEQDVLWVRQVPTQSLSTDAVLLADAYSRFATSFVVTDIGRTVEDTYRLDEPLRIFARGNGFEDYLQINQQPVHPWTSAVAEMQADKRRYLRMIGTDDGSQGG